MGRVFRTNPEGQRPGDIRRGFTLLEVLVALAIGVPAFVLCFTIVGEALSETGSQIFAVRAAEVGASLGAEMGRTIPLADGTRRGSQAGIAWTLVIVRRPTVTPDLALADVTIDLADRGGHHLRLHTGRLVPAS